MTSVEEEVSMFKRGEEERHSMSLYNLKEF